MATAKSTTNLHNGTLAASGGPTTTTAINLEDGHGATLYIKLTNGTAPTTPAQAQVEVSPDNSNWYQHGGPLVGSTTLNAVASWTIELAPHDKHARVVLTHGNQDVTARVDATETTDADA